MSMQVRLALLLTAPQPLEHVMGTFLAAMAGEHTVDDSHKVDMELCIALPWQMGL